MIMYLFSCFTAIHEPLVKHFPTFPRVNWETNTKQRLLFTILCLCEDCGRGCIHLERETLKRCFFSLCAVARCLEGKTWISQEE